jgi:hypothetical protein
VSTSWAQSSPVNYRATLVTGADAYALGSGLQNTLDIVAQGNTNAAECGAVYCNDLVSGGQSDWYLPSIGELHLMFNVLRLQLGLTFSNSAHWSSTETAAANLAIYKGFSDDAIANANKADPAVIRPIRRF